MFGRPEGEFGFLIFPADIFRLVHRLNSEFLIQPLDKTKCSLRISFLHFTFLVSRGWFRILFLLTSDRFDSVLGVQRLVQEFRCLNLERAVNRQPGYRAGGM